MCLTNDEEKSAKNRNGMTKYDDERVIITLKILIIYGTIVVISYDNYLTTSINISLYIILRLFILSSDFNYPDYLIFFILTYLYKKIL